MTTPNSAMTSVARGSLANQQTHNTITQTTKMVKDIKATLDGLKPELKDAMLQRIKPDYLISVVTTILRTRPELLECSPLSIISAVFQSAQVGLSLDPVLRQASLVPRYNKKTKQKEAQFMPQYQGLADLARRSGEVKTITAQLVREGDFFEFEYGTNEHLTHRPAHEKKGKITGVYAYATLKSGGFQAEYMTIVEVDLIRVRSAAGESGPWVTDREEMIRKTATRRLMKYVPMSTQLAKAVMIDGMVSAGITPEIDDTGEITNATFSTEEEPKEEPNEMAVKKAEQLAAAAIVNEREKEEAPAEQVEIKKPESYTDAITQLAEMKTATFLNKINTAKTEQSLSKARAEVEAELKLPDLSKEQRQKLTDALLKAGKRLEASK